VRLELARLVVGVANSTSKRAVGDQSTLGEMSEDQIGLKHVCDGEIVVLRSIVSYSITVYVAFRELEAGLYTVFLHLVK
jgi:hypothetical protein